MSTADFEAHRLDEPAFRKSILEQIEPTRESAMRWRERLLAILPLEMAYRADETNDQEYFENLYWCAFLLYLAGAPADVPLLWQAKHINFDTACGFDGQCFVGAGVDETLRFLAQSGELDIVDYIESMKECGDLDDLAEWERSKSRCYYGK